MLAVDSVTPCFVHMYPGWGWLHKLWPEWADCRHVGRVPGQGDHSAHRGRPHRFHRLEGKEAYIFIL